MRLNWTYKDETLSMKIEIIEQNFPHFVSWFYLQDVFFTFI